jgi:hypothetical protein
LIHVLLNITYGKLFLPGDAYPLAESSRPLAMLGSDGMDSTLEYTLSDMHGFLLLRPFVPGA